MKEEEKRELENLRAYFLNKFIEIKGQLKSKMPKPERYLLLWKYAETYIIIDTLNRLIEEDIEEENENSKSKKII